MSQACAAERKSVWWRSVWELGARHDEVRQRDGGQHVKAAGDRLDGPLPAQSTEK